MSYRILMGDDDLVQREFYGAALDRHDVEVVASGDAVVARALANRGAYDAIFTDHDYRGSGTLDGLEVIRRLQAEGVEAPIFMISGNGSETEAAARELGVDGFLRKPVRPADLRNALDEALSAAC